MHVLTLFVEGIASPLTLHYRGKGEASAALDRVLNAKWDEELMLTDDFGQCVSLSRGAIKVPVLVDIARGLEAQLAIRELSMKAPHPKSGLMVPANLPGLPRL